MGARLSGAVDERLAALLDAAERAGSCAVPCDQRDKRALDRRVAKGRLVSPVPGLYARTATWERIKPDQRALQVMRGLARRHPEWVFCGPSAALVHGLAPSYRLLTRTCVATSRDVRASDSPGVRRLNARVEGSVIVLGLRVTEFWETVFGCVSRLVFSEALAIADAALRVTGGSRDWAMGLLRRRFSGRRGIHRVLDVFTWADGASENGGESIARAQMIRLGFAVPSLQVSFEDPFDPGHLFRVDYVWRDALGSLVFGELDGNCKTQDERCLAGRTPFEAMCDSQERETRLTYYHAAFVRFGMEMVRVPEVFAQRLEMAGVPRRDPPALRSGIPLRPT